ncbi:uncharacterized protein LOC111138256 [Crassostrea virginica]
MESIRTSMKTEAESLKNLVDEVTSENVEDTHTMEKSLLKILKSQETTYDDYIAYLWKMSEEFQEYLSITNQKLLFKSKTLKIQPIPETTKPVPPVFTAGQFNKNDIRKLLVDKSDKLWASDGSGNLVQTDLQGNPLLKIQTSVVVVNKSGQHRFSYTGQGSVFRPCGICTDILGHIVLCDDVSNTVHFLDQDGRFLSLILSQQPDIKYPRGVRVDDENNLYVGQRFSIKVTVYKDLQ